MRDLVTNFPNEERPNFKSAVHDLILSAFVSQRSSGRKIDIFKATGEIEDSTIRMQMSIQRNSEVIAYPNQCYEYTDNAEVRLEYHRSDLL